MTDKAKAYTSVTQDDWVMADPTPRTAATARERVTEGDFAKALHDGYKVLGYWPDPDVIDGRWEMWGVVLHSLLAAADDGIAAALPAPAPTPSEPVARWTTCDDPQCGDSTWDHYCRIGEPITTPATRDE